MTDAEHAKAVRDAANALNDAIQEANMTGLVVEITQLSRPDIATASDVPQLYTMVARPIRQEDAE